MDEQFKFLSLKIDEKVGIIESIDILIESFRKTLNHINLYIYFIEQLNFLISKCLYLNSHVKVFLVSRSILESSKKQLNGNFIDKDIIIPDNIQAEIDKLNKIKTILLIYNTDEERIDYLKEYLDILNEMTLDYSTDRGYSIRLLKIYIYLIFDMNLFCFNPKNNNIK